MIPKRINFLDLNFDNFTLAEALDQVELFIKRRDPTMIFTPTVEMIVKAQRDKQLREIYERANLLTMDSFVLFYSAKLVGKKIKEPVSAARLMFNFLDIANKKRYKIYLLGAKEEVLSKAVINLKRDYPKMNIVGKRNGYFDFDNDSEIVDDIKSKNPDILFVAISSPLKEKFISKNFDQMKVPVSIGVGGSLDIIAGECSLAPEWVSKIGMEWFYRLLQEPRRLWKRYLVTNIIFLLLLLKRYFFKLEVK